MTSRCALRLRTSALLAAGSIGRSTKVPNNSNAIIIVIISHFSLQLDIRLSQSAPQSGDGDSTGENCILRRYSGKTWQIFMMSYPHQLPATRFRSSVQRAGELLDVVCRLLYRIFFMVKQITRSHLIPSSSFFFFFSFTTICGQLGIVDLIII